MADILVVTPVRATKEDPSQYSNGQSSFDKQLASYTG